MNHILFSALIGALAIGASGSEINSDTLYISTINSQSSCISISSYAYFLSGSSLSLQGSMGYITSASSVTASAFFGDGSHLTGILSVLSATQTFSGADTFVSSFTVQSSGRQINLSTSSVSSNLNISPSGLISFYPEFHNSSHTVIPDYQTTSTSIGPCAAGSTVTIATTGGLIEVAFTGVIWSNFGYAASSMNILQDGQFVRSLSASIPLVLDENNKFASPQSFDYLINAPPPGSHSYCLTVATLDTSTLEIINDSTHSNIFYVKELK